MDLRRLQKGDIVRSLRTLIPEDVANEYIDVYAGEKGKVLDIDLRRQRVTVLFFESGRRQHARMTATERAEWSALPEARKLAFASYYMGADDIEFVERPEV